MGHHLNKEKNIGSWAVIKEEPWQKCGWWHSRSLDYGKEEEELINHWNKWVIQRVVRVSICRNRYNVPFFADVDLLYSQRAWSRTEGERGNRQIYEHQWLLLRKPEELDLHWQYSKGNNQVIWSWSWFILEIGQGRQRVWWYSYQKRNSYQYLVSSKSPFRKVFHWAKQVQTRKMGEIMRNRPQLRQSRIQCGCENVHREAVGQLVE